jgi:hypothetical protein
MIALCPISRLSFGEETLDGILDSCFNPDQLAIQHSRRYQTPEAAVFQALRSSPPHLLTDTVANQIDAWYIPLKSAFRPIHTLKRSIPSLGVAGVVPTGAVYARGYPRIRSPVWNSPAEHAFFFEAVREVEDILKLDFKFDVPKIGL